MNWKELKSESQLAELIALSETKPVVVFKHSTRCSVSITVKRLFEREWKDVANASPYFLDLLNYRSISNKLAEIFSVEHESPQLLLIKQGKVVYHASHENVLFDDLVPHLN
jgi:bacillithiol system protein YtxJ